MVNPYRFYTYAYLRVDRTPYYIGKGEGNRAYKKYGRKIKPPKDKTRIIFLKQNLIEEEAFKHEKYMIAVLGRKDLGTGILHNRTDGGEGASGAVRSEETKIRISKSKKGKLVGKNNPNYGKSHFISSEERIEIGRKNYEMKVGIHGLSPEETLKNAKKGGNRAKELGAGFHGRTKEEMIEHGRMGGLKGGKTSSSQKWMCLETGFVTNAGNLTKYQNKRGIDTSKRKRIS